MGLIPGWFVLGPGHTKDVKNGSGPYLHGTQDDVGPQDITGLVSV